jgi:hypothetical protein
MTVQALTSDTSVLRGAAARGAVAGIIVQMVTSPTERSQIAAEQLTNVVAAAFGGVTRVAVVGGDGGSDLPAARPDLFVAAEGLSGPTPDGCEVLAANLELSTLRRAVDTARAAGVNRVFVLTASADGSGESLHEAGLALAGVDRLAFRSPADGATPAGSRAARLEAETEAVLLRCVLADDPAAVAALENEVLRLRGELEVRAQLEVDHAATREAERARADRLRDLEEAFERLGGVALVPEVERLHAELEAMRATRIWRLGVRWWRLRDRILGR